ncbi:hypothetical protein DIC82_11480 [Clostridium beijerinckii]|nr:hypothetical protein DIC82_11480 [Clostridium beijerinckii]
MKFVKEFFEIFDRDNFEYKKGDEETKNLFQTVHGKWSEWCSEFGMNYNKLDKPIIQSWQYGWGLHKSFWSRFKFTPFDRSATCISLYVNKDELAIELSYEFANKNSELSKEEYCSLLLSNIGEWSKKYNIDLNSFYIYAGKYKCTLYEYFNIPEKSNWFSRTNGIIISVGVFFNKEQITELDTESEKLKDILFKLSYLYEKVQKPNSVYKYLKNAEELIPDKHDGSYELVRETTRAFKTVPSENINLDDLDALFFTSVGTFRRKTNSKKELIDKSNLPDNEKDRIKNLMEKIDNDAKQTKYSNNYDGENCVGMFGTGFMTFKKPGNDENSAKEFIKLCTDIVDMDEEEEILSRTEQTLKNQIKGIGIGSLSTFLHCLKPFIFPIINGKEGQGTTTYEKLGIKLEKPKDTSNFIKNIRIIKEYRDKYFSFKNYRLIDIAKIEEEEPIEIIDNVNILENTTAYDNEVNNTQEYVVYTKENFLEDAYINEEKYNTIVNRLNRKNNIILQGAPGVGKSYLAKKIAYSILGKIDKDKVQMIQFHQSYSYEDFIMGYRPNKSGGFDIVEGVFYKFCCKAINNPNENFYFIIDEINRGNLSKIFGELMLLIECDKRGEKFAMSTVYSEKEFYIPKNLFIIGLMNTADRSIALIDYALRRRFSFIEIEPAFGERFDKYTEKFNDTNLNRVLNVIKTINADIEKDESLGKGFKIGHSYFCNLKNSSDDELLEIIDCDIIPLLEEYWIENASIVENYAQRLNEAVNNE